MPLDVLGRTRATLTEAASGVARKCCRICKLCRAGDRPLQLLVLNEEFLVSASHQLALIMSLPFVHTARRYYRLNVLMRPGEVRAFGGAPNPDELVPLEEVKVVTRFP